MWVHWLRTVMQQSSHYFSTLLKYFKKIIVQRFLCILVPMAIIFAIRNSVQNSLSVNLFHYITFLKYFILEISEFSWKSTVFECFTKGMLCGWTLFYYDKFPSQDCFWNVLTTADCLSSTLRELSMIHRSSLARLSEKI